MKDFFADDHFGREDQPQNWNSVALARLFHPERDAASLREQDPHVPTPLAPTGCILQLNTQP